jgi:hypothetical protein
MDSVNVSDALLCLPSETLFADSDADIVVPHRSLYFGFAELPMTVSIGEPKFVLVIEAKVKAVAGGNVKGDGVAKGRCATRIIGTTDRYDRCVDICAQHNRSAVCKNHDNWRLRGKITG